MKSPWSSLATSLFLIFLVFYFPSFGLFHWMIYKVNRALPAQERIAHSLYWGGWSRLRNQYSQLYPGSPLYLITLSLTIGCFILATAFALLLIWQFEAGK